MKNYHYLTLSLLLFAFSCTDQEREEQYKKLEQANQQLTSRVESQIQFIDSLIQEQDYQTELLDSLSYEIERSGKDRNYIEQVEVGEFQRQEPEDEDQAHGFTYRIEVYGAEIYKYFYISKIEYVGEMERRQAFRNKIDIESLLDINSEQTGNVEFQGWSTPSEFRLTRYDSIQYTLVVTQVGEVKVK